MRLDILENITIADFYKQIAACFITNKLAGNRDFSIIIPSEILLYLPIPFDLGIKDIENKFNCSIAEYQNIVGDFIWSVHLYEY